jgi:8-amino-7-oxononanoate synthase
VLGKNRLCVFTFMVDFTSSLYLGLRHPSWSLRPWSRFTTGVPAGFTLPAEAQRVAHEVAKLQGCESGVLGSSSFHLFWDLFGTLARRAVTILFDAELYPIGRWGVERAMGHGVPVHKFAHHDLDSLCDWFKKNRSQQPLLVTDGFCPDCGNPAPLTEYLEILRNFGGRLIVDDTQSFGIFGDSRNTDIPYGRHGGGMLRRLQIENQDVLLICSLAKAFGAPAAVLSGSRGAIKDFKANSETRIHCSPPSIATIRAVEHALSINCKYGDRLRLRLAGLVTRFRSRAAEAGLRFTGGLFPVQTLNSESSTDIFIVHEQLLRRGIRTVLRQSPGRHGPRISFVVTARHTPAMIDYAVTTLADRWLPSLIHRESSKLETML